MAGNGKGNQGAGGGGGGYDDEYAAGSAGQYVDSIPAEEDLDADEHRDAVRSKLAGLTGGPGVFDDRPTGEHEDPTLPDRGVAAKMTDYQKRQFDRMLTPARHDPFANVDQTPDARVRTYQDVLREANLEREKANTMQNIYNKQKRDEEAIEDTIARATAAAKAESAAAGAAVGDKRKGGWDEGAGGGEKRARGWDGGATPAGAGAGSAWDATPSGTGKRNRWDATPAGGATGSAGGNRWDATPGRTGAGETPAGGRNRWDATPAATTTKSRWEETPAAGGFGAATPAAGGAFMGATPVMGKTSVGGMGMATPNVYGAAGGASLDPERMKLEKVEREMLHRNRPLSDADLDAMMPSEGYAIVERPQSYVPIHTPARKLMATPMPMAQGYAIPEEMPGAADAMGLGKVTPDGIELKPEDAMFFGKLADEVDEAELSVKEAKERKIMRCLLKIKNGTPQQRKGAMKFLTDKARDLGAGPLFDQLLPLLTQPTLEDQERHLLVKVIDRVLFRLDDLVRPYVHKILTVVTQQLIDQDYYCRVEAREVIANVAKAAGLASMIAAMRPDIDHEDEYIRNITARSFAVVASALGIPALVPFLKAVCRAKKSWQARHTGIKIVQQIAILVGCAVLPHLSVMVEIIAHGLSDENQKVRQITALALAALAEASQPYGIEAFDPVLRPLWTGVQSHKGKTLAAFFKAIGFIIPLMDSGYANHYTREVMVILLREFQNPDEEMKKIILKVVKQCVQTDGVEPEYFRTDVLPDFFKYYWVRKMALDKRNYKALVDTTHAIAMKVGGKTIVSRLVDDIKDDNEAYRKVVMDALHRVTRDLGVGDVDAALEERLVDGVLYAFQEQDKDESDVMLRGFSAVIRALDTRAKPYIPQIVGVIKWRLNNKNPRTRMQAADLISKVAGVMKDCGEDQMLSHLGLILYENLGEEFPEVLGSLLGALKGIVNSVGMERMNPPIKDLLPRLTPILRNRHEKVQENCIDLVGRIADRGAEAVGQREWMRICFDLLDLLRAPKKAIRRAAVNTFGYIAAAIGPQDVLVTLLNNLKVQERQNRVCTTVAIAVVAESCQPFTVLPALMNEYRVPELNVQNGVLKSLSFMFEYIGEVGKDYIYAAVPLLEDALMDRDLVHRQTAAYTLQHLAVGVAGLGCEDALVHLLNFLWPNIFEVSPHLVQATTGAIESLRVALGPGVILFYVLQGLFHPARKVREVYWRLYNTLYVGSQDQLTAFYPALEDEGLNSYRRHELDMFV